MEALSAQLAKEPDVDQGEMTDVIPEKLGENVSVLKQTLKTTKRVALPELQDFYFYRLSKMGCRSYHMVFIGESGIDTPGIRRKKGRPPKGITTGQQAKVERKSRVQFIAAYTQMGPKLCRFFSGSMDRPLFEDFIEQLLCHCGKWPDPESVLIMNNAEFHYSDRVRQMCAEAGVRLEYTPPYTPRVTPIKKYFEEAKTQVRAQNKSWKKLIHKDFEAYVKCCVHSLGNRSESAEDHFRRAGYYVEEYPE